VLVDREPELLGAIGEPDPGALDAGSAPTQGDLAGFVAVANRTAVGVMATSGADDLGGFFFHQLGQDTQADAHRERQQALLGDSDELPERLLHSRRQCVLHLHAGLAGRYGFLHGGPPFDPPDRPKSCQRQRTKREDRRLSISTGYGTTSHLAVPLLEYMAV